jgi:undecaprenyl diphosphate synthase
MKIKHVAIIMDGNGRWAKAKGFSRIEGHKEGTKRVGDIIKASIEINLEALTLYIFSMENWQRPKAEVDALMGLLDSYLKREMKKLADDNIVFRAIGDLQRLPKTIQELLKKFESMTKSNTGLLLTGALSYSGREEILNAIHGMLKNGVKPEEINEKTFENYLYTTGIPNPDLIIRTSGEMRLSNFLLWQMWPDFTREEYVSAITEFQKRERRFGALSRIYSSK